MATRDVSGSGRPTWLTGLQFALPKCAAAGSGLLIGMLLLFPSEPVRAQAAGTVVRAWSCLASSAAGGSIFGNTAPNPACLQAQPPAPWPFLTHPRPAAVIAPPSPPTGLAATVSGQTFVLTWKAPSSGQPPTSHVVQAGSATGLADLVNASTGSSATQLTATDVPPGRYFVRVLARNASGTSTASSEIVVTVAGATTCNLVPPVPTGLATAASGSTVTLTWQRPAVGCPPTSYIIQAGSAPSLSDLANFSTGNDATSFSASGIRAGTYYIRVLAANAAGTSGPSPDVPLVVGGGGCSAPPGASPGLTVSVSGSVVSFAWVAASGSPASYLLQAGSSSGSSNLGVFNVGNAISYTFAGVPAGTYYVRVQATNLCGSGPVSNEVVVNVGGGGVTVTPLHGFTGSPNDGSNWSTLTQGTDGNFYGTSVTGGPFDSNCSTNLTGCGLLFKLTPSGTFTVLYTFRASGATHNAAPMYPYGALLQATDGNFYGTTSEGPAVFKMTPAGSVTYLTNLGGGSYGKLVQAADGNFYGTTALGGAGTCSADRSSTCIPQSGNGTVFKMTPTGTLTTLYVFTGGANGSNPYAGLVQATDGTFYGTTQNGGAFGFGTVFRIRPDGTLTTLYTFTGGADGGNPYAALIQATDGNFYGSALYGTSYNVGTIFKITPAGALTVLHTFTGYSVPDEAPRPGIPLDGAYPAAPLIQAPDGNLYGLTGGGGALSGGTAFLISPAGGNYTQLFAFSGNAEGSSPIWFIRATDGNYYGNCQYGGVVNMGAIFRMTPP